ncbi:unnamed protein product [Amaranthus hypochondriacus]
MTPPQNHLISAANGGALPNIPEPKIDNLIEEFPVKYTSIKEILTAKNYRRIRTEEEVMMIKNSLVRQAALAYLSPMTQPPNSNFRWIKKIFSRYLKEKEEKKNDGNDKVGCIEFIFGVFFG